MNIGIDLRALLNPVKTGVGEYADELIMNILGTPNQHRFFLFYNAVKPAPHLEKYSSYPNANLVATRWPNKVFNAATALFNYPRIDALIKKQTGQTIDLFFSPNLNLTALSSTTPHFLTIHDISFEFFPECFSRRQRLWHAAINPREVSRRAAAITTPSEHTRRDVAEYYGVDERKIHVLMPGLSSGFNTHLAALDTEQLLRARHVARGHREVLHVEGAGRRHPLRRGRELAAIDDLVHRVAVDRQLDQRIDLVGVVAITPVALTKISRPDRKSVV